MGWLGVSSYFELGFFKTWINWNVQQLAYQFLAERLLARRRRCMESETSPEIHWQPLINVLCTDYDLILCALRWERREITLDNHCFPSHSTKSAIGFLFV